jgi:hypothetical protein
MSDQWRGWNFWRLGRVNSKAAPPEKVNLKKIQLHIESFCSWLNNLNLLSAKQVFFLNLNTHFAAPWTLPLEAATLLVLT